MSRPSGNADVTRSAILAFLGTSGGASRADLARGLGVSPALMTQLVKDLISDGLVRELAMSPSNGGRPARLLGLAASAGRVIGMKVANDHVALVETELGGQVLRAESRPFNASSVTFLSALVELVREFRDSGGVVPILGVGVGVPGSVDAQGSGVVDSSLLGWRQVPLGAMLSRELGVPVLVENNVNALAVAERLYGPGRDHADFLVVTIGEGVGAGFVTGGTVVRGSRGGAGEIGHIAAVTGGPLCTCGNRGCIEALIGEAALVAQARRSGVIQPAGTVADLQAEADRGNPMAQDIFSEAGQPLGRIVSGLVQVLDPEIVIVSGEGTMAWSHWKEGFEQAFRSALTSDRRSVPVIVESWDDEGWARGAAALVASTPFYSGESSGEQGRRVRARLSTPAVEAIGS
ncbi:ROK family transcriptional regulator [Arthrobacter sp. AZCC_0090]|uniref:ROK family transcriptional regulator n=1 Tax=Arthrobacter sp. AZCC_0090 TaxID=2735881 RepID=UPI00160BD399|nr:ROK family transcriptional regulator [Arthrobacter sp. AZCC_0090]MBB6404235.1 putative NBD/HSP70 family sugar kinase [Arthrobacter sp. AZCC_0090]